jgi:HlyD family secretion protein
MVAFKDIKQTVQTTVSEKSPLVVTALVALLLGIGGTTLANRMGPGPRSAQPQPTATATTVPPPVISTVTALGRLEPQGDILSISAPSADGRIEQLRVKEGDRLAKGDIIAVMSSESRFKAALQQAEEQVRVAQSKLGQVQAGAKGGQIQAQRSDIARLEAERVGDYNTQSAVIARLEADLAGAIKTQASTKMRLVADYQNAKLEADRHGQLYVAGAISASLRDSKRLVAEVALRRGMEAQSEAERVRNTLGQQLQEARAALARSQSAKADQIDASRATLNQIEEVRPADVQTAQAEIGQARAAVEKAAADLEQAYVRSPQVGVVLKVHSRAGEKIATEGLIDMGQTQRMVARVEVYESDVKRIQEGQKAEVTSDAIGEVLQGRVSQIGQKVLRQNVVNTDPTLNADSRIIEVWVELDSAGSDKVARFTNSQVTAKIMTD